MTAPLPGLRDISKALMMNNNIRVLALTGLISGFYLSILNGGMLQYFVPSLGFSIATLGLLTSIGGKFNGIVASVVQPFAGMYADAQGRKVVVILGSATTIASMLLFLGAALTSNFALLLLAFLLYGLSTVGSPASQALIAESVGIDPERMGQAYGAVFLLTIAPGVVTPFIGGVIIDQYGYYLIFVAASLLESVNLYLYAKHLRETLRPSRQGPEGPKRMTLRESLRIPSGLSGIFATFGVDAFAFSVTGSIIYAIMSNRYGLTAAEIGLVVGAQNLTIILSQYPATRLLSLIGAKKTLAISEALGAFLMVGWAFADTLILFVLLGILFGVSVATWVPGYQSMLMAMAPETERGSVGGKFAAVRGLVAFPAPFFGGLLYQYVGFWTPMLASFVGAILATVLILKLVPNARRPMVREPAAVRPGSASAN